MSTAEEFKAKGNAALQAGKTTEAIENYTKAINIDGSNHVYYSNRSAAYLKKGDAQNALEDANACIGLKSDFAKGYSRKGAALHALKRYNDSIASYEEGLKQFPNDAGLKKGLNDVTKEKENPYGSPGGGMGGGAGGNPLGNLFGPDMMARMAMDPKLRPYLNDEAFMQKVKLIQGNPNLMPTMLQDPKMMEFLTAMMGRGGPPGEEEEDANDSPSMARSAGTTTAATGGSNSSNKKEEETKPMDVEEEKEEDWSNLTDAEREVKQKQKDAKEAKNKGNELYKEKKFDEALASYDKAIEIEPTNMTFLLNKGAVYLTMKEYDKCIEVCEEAVEVGQKNMAPFEDRAKALTRIAKAYQKKKDIGKAIEYCQKAQLESYDKNTQRLLKTMELEKKKADTAAYQDDDKAEEAKQRGNEFFRNKQFGEAVKEYEDAVKRSPKNAPIRNNLSAALCKIMDFNGAKRHIEMAVELDPTYVKAWSRKGDIEVIMKEYHKALESYKKGLSLDSTSTSCKEGLYKVQQLINVEGSTMTESEKRKRAEHSMGDPEIQSILTDPIIQQVLKDLNENPKAGQEALQDPTVRSKIEKLIAAGVLETR